MKKLSKTHNSKKYLEEKTGIKSKKIPTSMQKEIEEAGRSANEKINLNNQVYQQSAANSHNTIVGKISEPSTTPTTLTNLIKSLYGDKESVTSKMILYGYKTDFFDTEEELKEYCILNQLPINASFTVEYIGNMFGMNDVIRKTIRKCNPIYCAAFEKDGYAVYNEEKSNSENDDVWEYRYGSISEIYSAFREHGIVFENDIYGKLEKNNKCYKKNYNI